MCDMNQAAADALEPYRQYLQILAELHLDRRLRGKLDAGDVVQQTFLRAYSAFNGLRQREPEVLAAWLRKILASTLADAVKHYERDKRDIGLERSLQADLDRSVNGISGLAVQQTSPSRHAERTEELLKLMDALARLPDQMREVVILKHCRGWTLQQIAEHLGKTAPAVASLLRRGLENLRSQMNPTERP
jgi:RNA polymerase sigma-70 factor (ECF subfamily)